MAVNGQAYPIQLLDANGQPVGRAILIQYTDEDDQPGAGGGGGLPTGWTADMSDPANVATHGGSLTIDDGTNEAVFGAEQFIVASDTTDELYSAGIGQGFVSHPVADDVPCYTASGADGATVALDAGGLTVTMGGGDVEQCSGVSAPDGAGLILASSGAGTVVQITDDGMGGKLLGFFATTAAAQPGIPTTLGDVIAGLQALGLFASP